MEAALKLEPLQSWDNQVKANWDFWEGKRKMYSYATQKPANSLISSWFYPNFYQSALLNREFVENMQMLGDVDNTEVQEWQEIAGEKNFARAWNYARYGSKGVSKWSKTGFYGGALMGLAALSVRKTASWVIIPPIFFYALCVRINMRKEKARLGEVVDFTKWVVQKRKAACWYAMHKDKFPNLGYGAGVFKTINGCVQLSKQ